MTNLDIVMKLIGPIDPIGDSSEDYTRLENLKNFCNLLEKLNTELETVYNSNINRQEYSIQKVIKYIDDFDYKLKLKYENEQ